MHFIQHALTAAIAATALLTTGAIASNVTIAGGELDTAVGDATVYAGVPDAAKSPKAPACKLAERYTAYVNAGQFAKIATLYAEDAVVLEPTGKTANGRAEIAAFYEGTIGKMKPEVVAVSYVGNATDCMVELVSHTDIHGQRRYKLSSVDHFTLNATGKFARMVAFVRP